MTGRDSDEGGANGPYVLFVGIDKKLDALIETVRGLSDRTFASLQDHEARLRNLESDWNRLATKDDLEGIEERREKDMETRQRRIIAGTAAAITLAVPVLTYAMQQIQF
jgi:beta-lactamase class A